MSSKTMAMVAVDSDPEPEEETPREAPGITITRKITETLKIATTAAPETRGTSVMETRREVAKSQERASPRNVWPRAFSVFSTLTTTKISASKRCSDPSAVLTPTSTTT